MICVISRGILNLEDVEVLAREEVEGVIRSEGSRMLAENPAGIRSVEEGLYLLSF